MLLFAPLAGCWSAAAMFAPSEGHGLLADGEYRLVADGPASASGDRLRFTRSSDGSYRLDGPDQPLRATLVPLDAGRSRYLVQLERAGDVHHKALYLLLDHRGERLRVALLPCDGAAADAATHDGGAIVRDPQAGATCVFGSRAALVRTMRAVKEPDVAFELMRTGA